MAPVDVVVLDASVVVDLLIRVGASLPSGAMFIAPAHLDAEVLSALARLCRTGTLSQVAVDDMLQGLAELAVDRVDLRGLLQPAFVLRHHVSQHDSLYVAAAQQFDAALLTLDGRLAAACRQHGLCRVA